MNRVSTNSRIAILQRLLKGSVNNEIKMNTIEYLPWQTNQIKQLNSLRLHHRLPHALLITGIAGLGKALFITYFAKNLLCEKQQEHACGECHSCHLFAAENHPDFLIVKPEEEGKTIKIDQIREAKQFLSQSAHYPRGKIVVIFSAENMNTASSNAFLKTLEEPANNQWIFLVSEHPAKLSATIRSRCQPLHFSVPEKAAALKWLAEQGIQKADILLPLANGAPLKVKQLAENQEIEFRQAIFKDFCEYSQNNLSIVALSEKWVKLDLLRILWHLSSWLRDVIILKTLGQTGEIQNMDFLEALSAISQYLVLQPLFIYEDELKKARQLLMGQIAVNKQLLLENVLLSWKKSRQL
jgi:DNA polymerase-3 subunit delta'